MPRADRPLRLDLFVMHSGRRDAQNAARQNERGEQLVSIVVIGILQTSRGKIDVGPGLRIVSEYNLIFV